MRTKYNFITNKLLWNTQYKMIFEDLHFIVITIVYKLLVDFVVPDQILDIARIHNTPNGIWSIDQPFLEAYFVNSNRHAYQIWLSRSCELWAKCN